MTIDDAVKGLSMQGMRSLNQYVLVDSHNKYQEYLAHHKDKRIPFVLYVSEVYVPMHYKQAFALWTQRSQTPELVIQQRRQMDRRCD